MFVYCNNNPVLYIDIAGTKSFNFTQSITHHTVPFINGVDLNVDVTWGSGIGETDGYSITINTDDPENMSISYSTPTGETTSLSLLCNFSVGAPNNVKLSWGDDTYRLFVKGDDGFAVGASFNIDLDGHNVSVSVSAKINKLRAAFNYAIKKGIKSVQGSIASSSTGTVFGYGGYAGGGSLTPAYGMTMGGGAFVWTHQLR